MQPKNVSEPWFSLIRLGLKRCEVRLNKGDFEKIKAGDKIKFVNGDLGFGRAHCVMVTEVIEYDSFETCLECEGLDVCLPGIDNMDDALRVYRKYYSKEQEERHGVVSIKFGLTSPW